MLDTMSEVEVFASHIYLHRMKIIDTRRVRVEDQLYQFIENVKKLRKPKLQLLLEIKQCASFYFLDLAAAPKINILHDSVLRAVKGEEYIKCF